MIVFLSLSGPDSILSVDILFVFQGLSGPGIMCFDFVILTQSGYISGFERS